MVRHGGKVPVMLLAAGALTLAACGGEARSAEGPEGEGQSHEAVVEAPSSDGSATAVAPAPGSREAAALAVQDAPEPEAEPLEEEQAPSSAVVLRPRPSPAPEPAPDRPVEASRPTGGPIPAPPPAEEMDEEPAEPDEPDPEPAPDEPAAVLETPAPIVDLADVPEPVTEPAPAGLVLQPGVEIPVTLEADLSTRSHGPGDAFYGYVEDDVLAADGMVLVPMGARIRGRVVESRKSTGPNDSAVLDLALEALIADGRNYPMVGTVVRTEIEAQSGESTGRTVAKVGVGAAAGAILGKLLGKNTEAAVAGALVGAAAGTAAAISAKDGHALIPQGSTIVVRLDLPLELEPSR